MSKNKDQSGGGVYSKAKESALQNKTSKQVSVNYHDWSKDGKSILGRFMSTNIIQSTLNEGQYLQYLFDTDNGPVKFACGGQFDSEAGKLMHIGGIYEITSKGKEDIGGGRRVNKFDVIHYPAPGEVDPDDVELGEKPIIE